MSWEYLTRLASAVQPSSAESLRSPLVFLEIGAGLIPFFTGQIPRQRADRDRSRSVRRKRRWGTRRRRTRRPTHRRMTAVQVAADRGAIRSSCAQGAF